MNVRFFLLIGIAVGLCSCSSPETKATSNGSVVSSDPRHPVTKKMSSVTDGLAKKRVASFEAPDLQGKKRTLDSFLQKGPVVVYSIKEGCPCSTDFEPFANSLAKRFETKATLLGVYNESQEAAQKWAKQHSSSHPILVDPSLAIVKQLKQERSVYVALLSSAGEILKSWPGYSKSMLLELDALLQRETGETLPAFDTAYAPPKLASGCQLFEGEGFQEGDLR